MKTVKIVLVAVLTTFAASSVVQAAGQVQVNQSTTVSVDVQNNSRNNVYAAVKLSGYDSLGNSVGHLCRVVRLNDRDVTKVSYAWNAPAYATGLYWSPKIEVGGNCPNGSSDYSDVSDHDDDHDDDDHDDHHDDDSGDHHR